MFTEIRNFRISAESPKLLQYGRELLTHAGKVSHEMALQKTNQEFEKYKETQKIIENEKSLKELEQDINSLKKKLKK